MPATLAALPSAPSAPTIDWDARSKQFCRNWKKNACSKGLYDCPDGRIHAPKDKGQPIAPGGKDAGRGRGGKGKGETGTPKAKAQTAADPKSKRSLRKAASAAKGKGPHM